MAIITGKFIPQSIIQLQYFVPNLIILSSEFIIRASSKGAITTNMLYE